MTRNLTADERMDEWLNAWADLHDIPDDEREQYIEFLSGTVLAARARVYFAMLALIHSLPPIRWAMRMMTKWGER